MIGPTWLADAGSSQISVLRVRLDGSLRPVEDSPVSSGGSVPVTIAIHGDLVFVGNSGTVSNYTGFALDEGGHLRRLAHSTFPLPSGTMLGDVLFDGTGAHLVGTRIGTGVGASSLPSEIDSFTVDDDGHLTPAPGSPSRRRAPVRWAANFVLSTQARCLFPTLTMDLARAASPPTT